MINRKWAAFALALLCTGCTLAKYPEMTAPGPSATLVFSKGHHSSFGVSGSQTYTISENHQCTDKKVAATLLWTTPHSEPATVAAGHRIVVIGTTTYFYSTGAYQAASDSCNGSASFIVEAGHTYDVTQIAPFRGTCHFEVTDEATGASPASLLQSDKSNCGDYFKLKDE